LVKGSRKAIIEIGSDKTGGISSWVAFEFEYLKKILSQQAP